MSTANQFPTSHSIVCGACGSANAGDAQFCQSCGHALYEPCPGCSKPVLLGQAFCGGCGHDLKKVIVDQQARFETWMGEAIGYAKQHDFPRARGLLERVSTVTDFRHKDFADKAKKALEQIEALASREIDTASESIEKAKAASESGDHATVIQLLGDLPEKLLDKEAVAVLDKARTFQLELNRLETETQKAISSKNWALAGPLLEQLLTLIPDHQDFARLAKGVAKKLFAKSEKYTEAHRYEDAILMLDSVPETLQGASYTEKRQRLENLRWLASQFDRAPFASPILGRLAVRWTQEAESDPNAKSWVQRLKKELKETPRVPGNVFPNLLPKPTAWCGGSLGFLGQPTRVAGLDSPGLRAFSGRYNVALGLALQGLGLGRIQENFVPKKGIFGGFGRRKKKQCWGIDVGSAGIRAVCLELADERPTLVDSFVDEFETPLCRQGNDETDTEIIGASVAKFLEEKDISEAAIWINMPGRELISRFVRLPPLDDKSVMAQLEKEIDQRIPIPLDELVAVRWVAPLNEESVHGRPAVVVAAKQRVAEQRLELFKSLGLDVTGMQGDALALVNLIDQEFGEKIAIEVEEDESDQDAETDDENQDTLEDDEDGQEEVSDEGTPTIAMLDCGASKTTLILASQEAFWFWTVESGGEDITKLIARATKLNHVDAEKVKRNVAELEKPALQYQSVETRLGEIRSRLEMLFADAISQNKRFDVIETWCSGGGVMLHQYIQQVMLSDSSS